MKGGDKMPGFVEEHGISYPVAWDSTGATAATYQVDGYPDYHVIDRSGRVRVADLANGDLERVVEALLAEPAPSLIHPSLGSVAAAAAKKDTRILGVFGDEAQVAAFHSITKGDRGLATLLRNEYQVAPLSAEDRKELLAGASFASDAISIVAFNRDGLPLGSAPLTGLDAPKLRAFLEVHRLPQKNAEALWRDARAMAQREQKRILVHLGAPW